MKALTESAGFWTAVARDAATGEMPVSRPMLTMLAALWAASPLVALADYPDGPVRFVVPSPQGGLEDALTRMIAEDFQAAYGQPAAVVNRPGGDDGPFPGAVDVAVAPADGSLIGSFPLDVPLVGPLTGIPQLAPNPFEPVGIFLTHPVVIAAARDAPFRTMGELAAHAAAGNELVLGHLGVESPSTLVTLALARVLDFDFADDAALDAPDCATLASGEVDVINTTLALVAPCLDSLTLLAAIAPDRLALSPDTPSVAELAPDLALTPWHGLFVRSDTPSGVRDRIAAVAAATMASDRAQRLAAGTGARIHWLDAAAAQAVIERDDVTLATISEILAD
jgi:tripartite-type tricarboxylate transporter receptor subunit TctC